MPITQRKVSIPGSVTTVADVRRFIESCYDMNILRDLHKCLSNQMRGNVTRAVMRSIEVNDRVRFRHKNNDIEGTVTDIMRTKVKVRVWDDLQSRNLIWRVPATMLERLP